MILNKGSKIREMGTKKKLTKWNECTMLDQGSMEINENEKRELLRNEIERNRLEQKIGDVELFLNEHQDVFYVSEKELHQPKLQANTSR